MSFGKYFTFQTTRLCTLAVAVLLGSPCAGADWGYEELEENAPDAVSSPGHTDSHIENTSEHTDSPIEQWVELYSFVSPARLTDEQREEIRSILEAKAAGGKAAEVQSIEKFWPAVKEAVKKKPEQEPNYQSLLRALLRLQYRSAQGTAGGDSDILPQVLGPLRVASPGEPPLTEDAVDAFSDMACFLFEQKNPGRTMDAADNRTLFAGVVAQRYKDAPTPKDKLAVVNFDVDWSKFKIMWTESNPTQRKALLESWVGGKQGPAGVSVETGQEKPAAKPQSVSLPVNTTLQTVLLSGPWTPYLAATKSGSDPHPKAPELRAKAKSLPQKSNAAK